MRGCWQGNCLWTVMLLVVAAVGLVGRAHAGSDEQTPEEQYHRLIHVNDDLQRLGTHPFGEQVNLYTGDLSFDQTDIVLHGNGPDIVIARTFSPGWRTVPSTPDDAAFADWQLDVPRLTTIVDGIYNASGAYPGAVGNWVVGTGTTNRCTAMAGGPVLAPNDPNIPQVVWWRGYHLILPGQGSQELLSPNPSQPAPTMNGPSGSPLVASAVTANHWEVGCLPQTASGEPGEAFFVVAPDGTTYWLDWFTYTWGQTLAWSAGNGAPALHAHTVSAAARVTRVEDRFGNWVQYHYTGPMLTSITASDGRSVSIVHRTDGSRYIDHITVTGSSGATRTWQYQYAGITDSAGIAGWYQGRLSGVVLPDGSSWQFNLGNLLSATPGPDTAQDSPWCQGGYFSAQNIGTTFTGSITHPSGLVGTFTITPTAHTRGNVARPGSTCSHTGLAPYFYPASYYTDALVSKTFTGAGVNEGWSYAYSSPPVYWADQCTAGICPAHTVSTDVTDPGNNITRYSFDNTANSTMEGKLLATYFGFQPSTGAALRTVTHGYADPTSAVFNNPVGYVMDNLVNIPQQQNLAPVDDVNTLQDGQNYTWQALAFDAYAQPTDVKRSNDIAGQTPIEESSAYLNDTHTWVLGLPQTVTNVGTGEVESSNTYNSLDELTARARFGQPLMSYTWNSAGQLASFTDGNSHTTSLSDYYRGIPQSIAYPDNTHETLAVDDFGQIASITDQAGRTTQYSYDPAGRISEIDYPYDSSVDSASWYPKKFAYSFVTGTERGVAANHWRRTVTQGDATGTTYFDAELRPVLGDTSNGSTDITTATAYDWQRHTTFASYPVVGSPALSSLTTGIHSTYDALGRLTQTDQDSELGTLTTTTQYLPGPGTQVTDPKGNVTTTYFQAFDAPSYSAAVQINAPEGVIQDITRDVYGNPTVITQSGLYGTESDSVSKDFYYDSYHRLCRSTEPESGSTVVAYDNANNVAWSATGQALSGTGCDQSQVAAAARTVRSYDPMNRVLTIVPPSGTQSTSDHYDALGHVDRAVSGLATQTYAYNSLGLLTDESLAVAGSGYTWALGYTYDAYGHLTAIGYPAGSGTSEGVAYAPDAWGRPTQVGSYASGVTYAPDGQVTGFTYVSGAMYAATQNTRQLTDNFTDGTPGVLAVSEDLTYDKDANLTTVTDLVDGTRSQGFGYDGLNRLTRASASNLYGTESYTYDPLNNLRTRLAGGQTYIYSYSATNQLQSLSGNGATIPFGYDADGNETNRNGTTLVFDAKDQLTQVVGDASYVYDAQGRRVEKLLASSSAPVYAFYDHAGQLMYRYDPGAGTATNYIYLGTKLIARNVNAQLAPPGGIGFGTNPTAGSTTITWGASPTATRYTLQQSSNGGNSWSAAYSGSATGTTVSGLSGGSYLYRVQACDTDNCSAWTTSGTLGIWPALPTLTVPTGTINGPYTVSWTASASATGYTVQESLDDGAWSTIAADTPATSISRPGTTTGSYTYRVEASNGYGTAGWSSPSGVVSVNTAYGVMPSPLPTYAVPATHNTGSVTVSWSASAPVTGYTLQQSSNGGTNWTTVYSGTGTGVVLSGLVNGSYSYRLQACNDTAGDSVCTAWVAAGPMVVTLPPTTAPGLSVPAINSTGSYTVSWSAVAAATNYTLQEQVNGGSWATLQSSSATNWGASGQGNGTYGYRVQACNAGGCGPWSSAGTTTVTHPPASAPSLSVPATSGTGSYTVSWGVVAMATSYTLQEQVNGGSWTTLQASSATSRALSGKGNGTYGYRVQACNAGGCGPWSGTGTITVALVPAAPASVSIVEAGNIHMTTYHATWSAVASATSYVLRRNDTGATLYSGTATTTGTLASGSTPYAWPDGSVSVEACNANGCSGWTSSAP